jgi:hypothetical protein
MVLDYLSFAIVQEFQRIDYRYYEKSLEINEQNTDSRR